MNVHYQRRRDLVVEALRTAGVQVTPPKGRSTSGRRCPRATPRAGYCEHVLDETGVVVSPGDAYGPNGEGFFRISLTTPDDRLTEAMERIRGL